MALVKCAIKLINNTSVNAISGLSFCALLLTCKPAALRGVRPAYNTTLWNE